MQCDSASQAIRVMLLEAGDAAFMKLCRFIQERRDWSYELKEHVLRSRVDRLLTSYEGDTHRGLDIDEAVAACEFAGRNPVGVFFDEAAARGHAAQLRAQADQIEASLTKPPITVERSRSC